jgi:acyl-ACP thioesterase
VRTQLDYLGETADSHIRELGVSIQDLLAKGLLWVLVGYRLNIARYPRAGEKVTVNTWYPGRHGRFYLRDFEVYGNYGGGDGNLIAAAASLGSEVELCCLRLPGSGTSQFNLRPQKHR